ncbi:MAG TPA: hypothetical protein VMZ25_00645 [Terriglobales bacterium]|nr:hypothetical protein [Terriglobales bacterium]
MRTWLAVLLLFSTLPATADLKIVTRRSFGGHPATAPEVKYVQGQRVRTEYRQGGDRHEHIFQCDLHRVIDLNARTKLFATTDLDNNGLPVSRRGARPRDPEPAAEYTVTAEDTGERATIFGMPAWHVRETVVKTSPGPYGIGNTVTDYWFVDLKVPLGCRARAEGQDSFIGDNPRFKIKRVGEARRGFPVLTRTVMSGRTGKTENVVQVTEISTAALDPKLFDIPEGFAPALQVGERADLEKPDTMTNRVKAHWDGFWMTMAKFIY